MESGNSQNDGLYTIYSNNLKSLSDYQNDITLIGDINNPATNYSYSGDLSKFNSARESVSCTNKDSCFHAFGSNLSTEQLNTILYLRGSDSRATTTQSEVPPCTNNYNNFIQGINDRPFCDTNTFSENYKITRVTGWQTDIHGLPFCWSMRSSSFKPNLQGSSLCRSSGEPNGTRYSTVWMR